MKAVTLAELQLLPEQLADLLGGHMLHSRQLGHVPVTGWHSRFYQCLFQFPEQNKIIKFSFPDKKLYQIEILSYE
jgi:hypothetical protein